jgi:solute carrier family 25 oxoglutarate transporter 11
MATNSTTPKKQVNVPTSLNFFFGGLAGCLATCVVQPIDMIKTQIQLSSESGSTKLSPIAVAKNFVQENSFKALYRGIDSALLRQVLYTTTRFGIFYSLNDYLVKKNKGKPVSVSQRVLSALTAGGIGAAFANPADLILIRMQADSKLPPDQRRNYTSVFNGINRIVNEEGFVKLWTGALPTITRAMVLNIFMLAPFEEFKERLKNVITDTTSRTVVSALIASFLGSFSSLPFDNCKTKIQKMRKLPDGSYPYNGMIDCFFKTIKKEGPFRLWVGFPTFYVRIGPHVIISLLLNDFFRVAYIKKMSV